MDHRPVVRIGRGDVNGKYENEEYAEPGGGNFAYAHFQKVLIFSTMQDCTLSNEQHYGRSIGQWVDR